MQTIKYTRNLKNKKIQFELSLVPQFKIPQIKCWVLTLSFFSLDGRPHSRYSFFGRKEGGENKARAFLKPFAQEAAIFESFLQRHAEYERRAKLLTEEFEKEMEEWAAEFAAETA